MNVTMWWALPYTDYSSTKYDELKRTKELAGDRPVFGVDYLDLRIVWFMGRECPMLWRFEKLKEVIDRQPMLVVYYTGMDRLQKYVSRQGWQMKEISPPIQVRKGRDIGDEWHIIELTLPSEPAG